MAKSPAWETKTSKFQVETSWPVVFFNTVKNFATSWKIESSPNKMVAWKITHVPSSKPPTNWPTHKVSSQVSGRQGTSSQEQLPKHLRSVKVHFHILRIYPAGPDHPQIFWAQKKGQWNQPTLVTWASTNYVWFIFGWLISSNFAYNFWRKKLKWHEPMKLFLL